jgi:hypothetical protein
MLTCGALRSVALSPRATPWLAAVGGAVRTCAARVFRRRIPCPRRTTAVRHRPDSLCPRHAALIAHVRSCRRLSTFDHACPSTPRPRHRTTALHRLCPGERVAPPFSPLWLPCSPPSRCHVLRLPAASPSLFLCRSLLSRAAERCVTSRLTATPLPLWPGDLTTPPALLRSRHHSERVAGPPTSVKSPPPSTRATPP